MIYGDIRLGANSAQPPLKKRRLCAKRYLQGLTKPSEFKNLVQQLNPVIFVVWSQKSMFA
jgi:hypothetical protein